MDVLARILPLGEIYFRNRPEHTPGTLDLILGQTTILGSQRNTTCTPNAIEIPPHGNVIL